MVGCESKMWGMRLVYAGQGGLRGLRRLNSGVWTPCCRHQSAVYHTPHSALGRGIWQPAGPLLTRTLEQIQQVAAWPVQVLHSLVPISPAQTVYGPSSAQAPALTLVGLFHVHLEL